MRNYHVTFSKYYDYDVEAYNEDDAHDKAYEMYASEMRSPIADTTYDEMDIECEDIEEDEEEY